MINEYRAGIKTHWINAWPLFLMFAIYMGIVFFDINIQKESDIDFLLTFFIALFSIQFSLQLALHLNYYYTNKGDTLLFDTGNSSLVFTHENNSIKFFPNEIASVVMFKSFALAKGNIQLLTWDSYNHSIITLNNGTKIIITSLLVPGNLSLACDEKKIIVKMNAYRWVLGSSLQLK